MSEKVRIDQDAEIWGKKFEIDQCCNFNAKCCNLSAKYQIGHNEAIWEKKKVESIKKLKSECKSKNRSKNWNLSAKLGIDQVKFK